VVFQSDRISRSSYLIRAQARVAAAQALSKLYQEILAADQDGETWSERVSKFLCLVYMKGFVMLMKVQRSEKSNSLTRVIVLLLHHRFGQVLEGSRTRASQQRHEKLTEP
jgi:hypothetical protein